MISFDVIGARASAADIAEMGGRAMLMQPAFVVIRELILRGFASNFASEGGTFGETWPPLAPATVQAKGSSAVLDETGALGAALRGGRGKRTRVSRSSLSVGVDGRQLFYGRFAQGGTEDEPARPIVGITPSGTEQSITTMQRYIVHGLSQI